MGSQRSEPKAVIVLYDGLNQVGRFEFSTIEWYEAGMESCRQLGFSKCGDTVSSTSRLTFMARTQTEEVK